MSDATVTAGPRSSLASMLAQAALGLYPGAWRARYGDEVRALMEDSGADRRTVASLVWRAIPAWIWPPQHLYDRPARIRASLGTVLCAWSALMGMALIFAQLTQAQGPGATPPGHPVIAWSYWIFYVAIVSSVLLVAAGGLPLWLRMLGDARRDHSRRDVAYLLAPILAPALYLGGLAVVVRFIRHPGQVVYPTRNTVVDVANGGVSPWWFLVLALIGFAAAGVAAAGPMLALRRLRPSGPQVGRAARAAVLAAATMGLGGAASIVAAFGLYRWAPAYAGYHQAWQLGIYIPLVLVAVTVAVISAVRGIQATRTPGAA